LRADFFLAFDVDKVTLTVFGVVLRSSAMSRLSNATASSHWIASACFISRVHCKASKYPPAEPEALRLLAPQRGLIATDQNQNPRLATSGLIGKSGKGLGEADC